MDRDSLIAERFRPLGRRDRSTSGSISRRVFFGMGVAAPVSLLLVRDATGQQRPFSADPDDLRFDEDNDGISILSQRPDPTSADRRVLRVWRLKSAAFGPDVEFVTRTLLEGKKKGYELGIRNARFGSQVRSHKLVFQRSPKGWMVRMRSHLWAAQPEAEVTSNDVRLDLLSVDVVPPKGALKEPAPADAAATPPRFEFRVSGATIASALHAIFEGHVRADGALLLHFDTNCVWRLSPANSGGRVVVAPHGFALRSIEMAWCEPMEGDANGAGSLPDGVDPVGKVRRDDETETTAEPVFCGGGSTDDRAKLVRFRGDGPFSGSVFTTGDKKEDHELTFSYVRQDWDWNRTRDRNKAHAPGVASVMGRWLLSTKLSGRETMAPVEIAKGTLEFAFDTTKLKQGLRGAFTGSISSEGKTLETRIGKLHVRGWNDDDNSRDSELPRVDVRLEYPSGTALGQTPVAAAVDVPLLLLESYWAPKGSQFSRFIFEPTLVNAFWRQQPDAISDATSLGSGSFLWLGALTKLPNGLLTRLDLTRARLEVSHAEDLQHLAFMFADLNLEVFAKDMWIRPASSSCRVLNRESRTASRAKKEALLVDARPTLVVEFPPQHMLEQVLFRPSTADLPDVTLRDDKPFDIAPGDFKVDPREKLRQLGAERVAFLKEPAKLVVQLRLMPDYRDRKLVRATYAQLKIEEEARKQLIFSPFKELSEQMKAQSTAYPDTLSDQFVYIGPYEMDADIAALARDRMQFLHNGRIDVLLKQVLETANTLVQRAGTDPRKDDPETIAGFLKQLAARVGEFLGLTTPDEAAKSQELSLLKEVEVAGLLPEYEAFRDFYRETMTKLLLEDEQRIQGEIRLDYDDRPLTAAPEYFEFFSPDNRRWPEAGPALERRERFVRELYIEVLAGKEQVPPIARARLANPSRLAFRVNCGPTPTFREGKRKIEHRDDVIPFSLDALTDWSRHELAVPIRARAPMTFDEAGRPSTVDAGEDLPKSAAAVQKKPETPAASEAKGEADGREDVAMLRMLGMRSGRYITAQERLTDVEASLRAAPSPIETAIEIPARLILSPSQRAQWRTPHKLEGLYQGAPKTSGPGLPTPLWSACLALDGVNPQVRAVHSPDLRPGFVRRGLEKAAAGKQFRTPLLSAPPRGPRAPWTLGVEEGDPGAGNLNELYKLLRTEEAIVKKNSRKECPPPPPDPPPAGAEPPKDEGVPQRVHPLAEYLYNRSLELKEYKHNGLFRSSLDAYDRHEIVCLSSMWGLPVRGRREVGGQLMGVSTSSQTEPPELFQPIDLEKGTALYRPRALKVQELRLTALGGSFRHDTDFVPPSAARHIAYGSLHNSFSIERWQHWTVLGRDVFAEVVYKGFLFPTGHRASLVKQTERVFLRAQTHGDEPQGSVRAYLRQRMFIRIGQPDKAFPALGQPNIGRQFPVGMFRMLTTTTPDLVDPAQDTDDGVDLDQRARPEPSGRLFAKQSPGLVFWPRTARLEGAEVRFEALIDSSFVNLPLIFVDNVAKNDPGTLAALVKYYVSLEGPDQKGDGKESYIPSKHLRTVDFSGQSHRYCDEFKPGSATHKTLYWTLGASGVSNSRMQPNYVPQGDPLKPPVSWVGVNDKFDDPSLEGADQPPFYPTLEVARIRLDQVERMTANTANPAVVKFDGYFVVNGFTAAPERGAESSVNAADRIDPNNPLGIYLNVVNEVPFTMGSGGDRSGGMFRPESHVIALSRERGPVCGSQLAPAGDNLISLVSLYDGHDGANQQAARERTYGNFFSSRPAGEGKDLLETKLLGVVKIKDLLKCMNLKSLSDGAPELREVVDYGVAGAASTADALRKSVIAPLHAKVEEVQARWNALGKKLAAAGQKVGPTKPANPLTMREVFPEVHYALADFRQALGKSVATRESAEFYTSLGEVYESGRRLVDALGRASANPIERVYIAVAQQLQGKFGEFQNLAKEGANDALAAIGLQVQQRLTIVQRVAEAVTVDDYGMARFLPLSFLDPNKLTEELRKEIGQELAASLAGVVRSTPDAALDQFVEWLKTRTQSLVDWSSRTTERRVRVGLEPLYRAAQALAKVTAQGEASVGLLAAAVLDLLKTLVPEPLGKALEQGDFNDLVKGLVEELRVRLQSVVDGSGGTVPKMPTPMSQDAINIPKDVTKAASDWFGIDLLAESMLKFAAELEKVRTDASLAGQKYERLHEQFVALGNSAVSQVVTLLELAKAYFLAWQRLQKEANENISRLHGDVLTEMFALSAQLLKFTDDILGIVLPRDMPDVEALNTELRTKMGNAVGYVLRQVYRVQLSAMKEVVRWTDRLKIVQAALQTIGDGSAAAAEAAQGLVQTASNFVENNVSKVGLGSNKDWHEWHTARDTVRPMLPRAPGVTEAVPAIATFDHLIQKLLTQWWQEQLAVHAKYAALPATAIAAVLDDVITFYEEMRKLRNEAYAALTGPLENARLLLLVRVDHSKLLKGPDKSAIDFTSQNDQLHWDVESLVELQKRGTLSSRDNYRYAAELLRSWKERDATPFRILDQLQKLNLEDARARLLSLLDFSSIREEIDKQIRQLIPVSTTLTYSFDAQFNGSPAAGGIFLPQEKCGLTIRSETQIDFVKRKATFKAVGELGAFDIQLVGSFKALKIMFEGATFESSGGPIRCDVRYKDFEIQDELAFLSQLASFFTPDQGSGFYLVPLRDSIGIEAGYGLNIGTISIGTVSFFNVSLNAAARLPFDGKPATFVASLSRRDSPFTVSFAPYGGSGFFALEADGTGITGFEASFEYGGAAAFQYGPLSGQGRLMVGVYIRKRGKECMIGATFYAGGTASIWIFNFGASLYVRAVQVNQDMTGEATFTFSFSMGIVDYDYSVSVKQKLNWQGGGGGGNSNSSAMKTRESREAYYAQRHARKKSRQRMARAVDEKAKLRVDTWCQGADWGRYRSCLDLDVDVDLGNFA